MKVHAVWDVDPRPESPPCVGREVKEGAVRTSSLPRCSGTVILHRGDAVTCSRGTCPKNLSKAVWLSLHWRFVRCIEVLGRGGDCPECGFVLSTESARVL